MAKPTRDDFIAAARARYATQRDAPSDTHGQGILGDVVDMFQRGLGQTLGGDLETVGQIADSQGFKDAGRGVSAWGEGQLQQVSPEMREAMGKQFFQENAETGAIEVGDAWADPRAWAGNFATVLGQFTALVGGTKGAGVLAKPVLRGAGKMFAKDLVEGQARELVAKATVKDAISAGALDSVRAAYLAAPSEAAKRAVLDKAIGRLTSIGYGAHAGAMASGMRAQQAEQEARGFLNGLGNDELNANPIYQQAYWDLADGDMQGASVDEIRRAAIDSVAEKAATDAWSDPRALTADFLSGVLTGAGGGVGGALGQVGRTRAGAAVRGFVGEGVTEAWQGGETQRAVNQAVQEWADETRDPMAGVLASALNEGTLGGAFGGVVGGVHGPEPQAASKPVVNVERRVVTGDEQMDDMIHGLDQRQAERGASINSEIENMFAGANNPLGSGKFDPIRDVPAYERQGFVRGTHDFRGTEIPGPLDGELMPRSTDLMPLGDSASLSPIVSAGSAAQGLAELAGGQGQERGRPALTDLRRDGELMPQELPVGRAGMLPGATIEGEGREVGSELPFRDFITAEDGRPAQRRAADIERRGRELADQPAQIGQSDTIFAGGAPGSDQRNGAYTPPRLSRDQVDRSLGEQSTRDPRSPVARAIEQAGGEHDSIFGPLKSLRITRKGKPFATEKEAALASRKGQETPVPLNGGGFGVAAIEEVEQAKGAIADNSEEQSHEQIAGVDPVGSKGEGDQQPAGAPVSAVAGAEPDTADALPAPAREHSPAPDAARDESLPDDDALTPAPAGVAVSEEAKPEKAASEPVQQIEFARAEVAPEPTEAQKDAGNYKKGHLTLHGLDIALENPKGSTRSGTDRDGKAWQSTMAHDYGYIKRTQGADGDHVDVFIGDEPDNGTVYVVDQVDPKTGKFDEHKVMMGFASEHAAREGYLANYDKGWKGLSAIKAMPMAEFKRWVKEGDTTKPIAASLNSDGKITDFGEKIGGARKDIWASYRDSIQGDTVDEIKELPLSKVWPAPDYQKLLDSGIQPWFVAYARAARDSIPAKPQTGWKQQRWAEAVKTMRDTALGLLAGDSSSEQLRQQIAKSGLHLAEDISNRAALYEAVGHQRSLADLKLRGGEYSLYNGVKYDPPKQMWTLERGTKSSSLGNWPRIIVTGDTKQEAIAAFKARYEELTAEASKPKAVTFDIYSRGDGWGWFVGKKLGRNYLDLTPAFEDVKKARVYRAAHQDELIAKLEQYKAIPRERRDLNQPRVGEDMRAGQDITPEQFASTFGFRGVEFGNWVEQGRRQRDLNDAFDALMDMAAILGIPPKAISLNGELGLAFGARGSGGVSPAAAHYEPGKIVINLTKMNGAGSLGHEWWHALDNYFSRLRGKPGDNMTTALDVSLAARGSNFVHRGEVRKEMVEAFGAVMRAIKQTSIKARSQKIDSRRSKAYWATDVELSARAFESYLIAKLQDQSASNDYLANIVSEAQWEAEAALGLEMDGSYPYATAGEVPAIRAGFDQFFDTLESKQEGDRTILFSKQSQAKGDVRPTRPLTRKEAEMVTNGWLKQYQGMDGIDIHIHATQAEMERALGLPPVDGLIRRAAFDRTVDALHVAADTIANPRHLREILRHEVLAHYGLAKVLGGVHYTRLLSRVMGSRNDASMKGVWEWVQTHYADEPVMVQAEEVIAHLAELEPSAWRRGWDRVVSWVTRALRTVGFVSDGVTAAEIRSMIEAMGKQLEKGSGSESNEIGGQRFSAERTPWKPGFPEVILHGRLGDATAHPDYEAAKGGDDAAARRLVSDVLSRDAVRRLKELIGDREAIALGVHAEEAVSRNAIPRAMADVLATVLDMDVDLDIVQAAKVGRTAQDGFGRLANQPNFDGPVRTDKPYLIMDDTLTQGGTLANLKGYIEARGGEVLAATALTGKQYSAKIAIDSSTLEQLRDQYDGTGLEAWWQNRFGYGFDSLTESEARYLLRAKDADKIRDRVAAAGQSSPARSEHESDRDDGSLPSDGLKFSQSFGADDALQKLNLGRKPDIIDRAHERLDTLRGTDRATVKGWVDRFIQKANTEVLDALAPIKYAEDAAGVTDASESGYVAARMASGAASTMQATMLYGLPEWKGGVIQRKAGTGEADALLGIFEGLGKDLHNWLGWMAGHRAEILMAEGRENLLTAQDIAALKALDEGKEAKFLDAKRRWNALNAATLDLAQEAGLFTAEERAKWESEWYIPFFREGEDGDALAPFKAKGVANQSAGIKKLKGGTAHTADLLENIFTSTSKLIDASMKNMAAQKTVWNLADTGIIEVVAKPNMMDWRALQKGRELITVKLEGEDYLIRVNDPDLYRAMTFFDRQPHGKLVQIAAGAKRLLTAGVTASPEFMLRNFLRDSLSSWAISKDGFKPVIDSIKGVKKTLTMDGSTIDVMFSGASFLGGYVNGNDPKAMADSVRKALRRKGMTPEQIERYERSLIRNAKQAKEVLGKAWDQYSKYGEALENANREAVYEAAINNGKSHAQAAFEAKDLMDFSMLGASRVMQTLVMVLPFFNARVQGLGKLARELRDNPRAIAKRAGMITAASLALLAMNWDDERYEELPDWDKDANWHMWLGDQHFRIPKPFEIGVMFGTIPERMVRAMGDKDTGAQFGKAVARAVGETFALNPIPQIVKPMSEAYFNYDPFRGGPIENFADQSVMPQARYSEQTSLLMRELGQLTGMSPKKLEHIVVGYTGTLGGYVLSAADGLIRASRPGESAALRADEIPLIKAVYRGSGPAKSTQHMDQFYRMLSEVNELKRTVDQYRKEGMGEEAKALLDEQGGILKARRSLSQTQTQVRQLRNRLELIQRDQTLSADEKRSRIDAILAKRNDLVYRAVERTRGLWQ